MIKPEDGEARQRKDVDSDAAMAMYVRSGDPMSTVKSAVQVYLDGRPSMSCRYSSMY